MKTTKPTESPENHKTKMARKIKYIYVPLRVMHNKFNNFLNTLFQEMTNISKNSSNTQEYGSKIKFWKRPKIRDPGPRMEFNGDL